MSLDTTLVLQTVFCRCSAPEGHALTLTMFIFPVFL